MPPNYGGSPNQWNPPPPQGPFGPPPQGNFGPAPGGYPSPGGGGPFAQLERDTSTWLVVVAASWFFGLMWIGGPLGWYQGSRIIGAYQSLGAPAPSNATTLRLVGMISTLLSILFFVGACVFTIFVGGVAFLGNRH